MKLILDVRYALRLGGCWLVAFLVAAPAQAQTEWLYSLHVSPQAVIDNLAPRSRHSPSRISPLSLKLSGAASDSASPEDNGQSAKTGVPTRSDDFRKVQSAGLFSAMDAGDVRGVSRLLQQGISINVTNERDMLPLVFLFSMNPYRGSPKARLEIARLLLSRGADANGMVPLSVNSSRVPVLVWAIISSRSPEVVQLFLKYGANPRIERCSSLFTAVMLGEKAITEILVDHGADVNARDEYGQTPLFLVDSLEVAKVLVNRGADVNAKDKDGISVLKYLSDPYKGCGKWGCIPVNKKVVSYLKSKNAN